MSPSVTVPEFAKIISSTQSAFLVDVRRADEFTERHVKGASHFPLDDLNPAAIASSLGVTADSTIFILCKGGTRAGKAAERFRAAGILNVCVVDGGTDGCASAGVPCEGTAV
jgi:rhodanese-related sulfurtransferase